MEYRLISEDEGTRIEVLTEEKAAVVVRADGEERIYLPLEETESSTYYVDEPSRLVPTKDGYTVIHQGQVSEVEVFSK